MDDDAATEAATIKDFTTENDGLDDDKTGSEDEPGKNTSEGEDMDDDLLMIEQ
jgi:hypothetical protein